MSLEPPSDPSESNRTSSQHPVSESSEMSEITHASSMPQHLSEVPKPRSHGLGRVLIGLGVFAGLSGGILLVSHMMSSASSMGGHDMSGHDMSGMSHDDMMTVDGAFNPIPVTVEVVHSEPFESGFSYTGSIMPYQEVVVYPRIAGQLTDYSVYPGDRIQAGEILAQLDATERSTELLGAQAEAYAMETSWRASQVEIEEQIKEIERLQAELDYLKLREERFNTLSAEGAISIDEYDIVVSEVAVKQAAIGRATATRERLQAEAEMEYAKVQQAEAEVNTAAVMEGYTTVASPISGLVQDRMVDPGVVVQPNMGILKIGDYSRVRLQANVSQQDAGYIRIGTPIEAHVPGATDTPIQGKITSIFPQSNSETRTVMVEALVDNPQGRLLSGQFLDMKILTGRKPNALSVPQQAIVDFNGELSVWVVEGNAAQRRVVETGMVNGERIEIKSGLNPDDQVITSGHSRLRNDVQVAVVDDVGNPVPMLGGIAGNGGAIDASIISPDIDGLKMGGAELMLEVRDPDTQQPLAVEDVEVDITMPMANMAPMTTMVQLEPADATGQFNVKTHFGMAGEWHIEVKVNDNDYAGQTLIAVPVK